MAPHITFRLVSAAEAPQIAEGTILFLPPKETIPRDAHLDEELQAGGFNHPIVVISCPKKINYDSVVEIAIMTSFNNTLLRKHLAQKGIKVPTNSIAAQKSGYLRVVTASKPYATDTLKLRNGKGMKRDCSYVGVRNSYRVQVKALALYGGQKEEVDAYTLTAHATKAVIEGVGVWREKARVVEKKAEKKEVKEAMAETKQVGKKAAKVKEKESKDESKIPEKPKKEAKAKPIAKTAKLKAEPKITKKTKTEPIAKKDTRKTTTKNITKKEAPATARRRTSLRIAELNQKMKSKNRTKATVKKKATSKRDTRKTTDKKTRKR